MSMRLFGIPYRVTNRVVEFELNRLIAWRHFEPQRWRYELEPVTGGTRVRESFDYSSYSMIGRWLIRLVGWPERNRRAIAQTLLRLRAAAEDRTATQHHGLDIVRALASDSGIHGDHDGRTIWARFDWTE